MDKKPILAQTQLLGLDFTPGVLPPPESADALCLAFADNEVLLCGQTEPELPSWDTLQATGLCAQGTRYFLGHWRQTPCFALDLPHAVAPPPDCTWFKLRMAMRQLPPLAFGLIGRAYQIIQWDKNHRFCGRCGTPMQQADNERVKRCPDCGLANYPRIAPAVIMRIRDGGRILLSRARHFKPGMYSVQAGFVEPGETLEDAVIREIREEVGLEICHVRYFGSQPWPFPDSLMVAFTAEYASGALRVDPVELEDAAWFEPGTLPGLPPPHSIARRLIEDFLHERH